MDRIMPTRRRVAPRSSLPRHIERAMAPRGLYVASLGDSGGFCAHVDLAEGLVRLARCHGGRRDDHERRLDPEELARVDALVEATWAEEPAWWGHPQTVVGEEVVAIVDGDAAFFAEARSGWFTGGGAQALVRWGQSLIQASAR